MLVCDDEKILDPKSWHKQKSVLHPPQEPSEDRQIDILNQLIRPKTSCFNTRCPSDDKQMRIHHQHFPLFGGIEQKIEHPSYHWKKIWNVKLYQKPIPN